MKYFLRIIILIIAAGLLAIGGCRQKSPTPPPSEPQGIYPEVSGEPSIRIRALASTAPLELIVAGPYKMRVVTVNGENYNGAGQSAVTIGVTATDKGVKLGKDVYREAEIIPEKGVSMRLRTYNGGKSRELVFPGSYTFSRDRQGRTQIVVSLPMERYLVGVVAGEMPMHFPPESLKALAVAARTFALYHLRTRAAHSYDVECDTASQVWNPAAGDARARMAVTTTRGQIITENHRLFPAYFSADCGGVTTNGKYVFPAADVNALSGGVRCAYPTPYTWKKNYTRETISAKLSAAGLNNGRLLRLELLNERKESLGNVLGRVYYVRLVNENNVERIVSAESFRKALGNGKNDMASVRMLATFLTDNHTISFQGQGFGHGVGLCQHGAAYEAGKNHKNHREILEKYYPGAEVVKVW